MPSATVWWSNCAVPSLNTIAEWKYASCNRALHILCYPDYSLWKHKLLLWGIKLCLLQNRDKSSTCISDKHSNHWFRTTQSFFLYSELCTMCSNNNHIHFMLNFTFWQTFNFCFWRKRFLSLIFPIFFKRCTFLFSHTYYLKQNIITLPNLVFKSIATRKCFIIDEIIFSGKTVNYYLSWTIFQIHYNDLFCFS